MGQNILTIYDKYGSTHFTAEVDNKIAAAPEEEQIVYIESVFNDVLDTLEKKEGEL